MRWLAWADVFLVVYDITSQLSFQWVFSALDLPVVWWFSWEPAIVGPRNWWGICAEIVSPNLTLYCCLRYAESILDRISKHEHLLCAREHRTILLGNKNDLERYRFVFFFKFACLFLLQYRIFYNISRWNSKRVKHNVLVNMLAFADSFMSLLLRH